MKYLESTVLMVLGMQYADGELGGALFQVSMLPSIKNSWTKVKAITYILVDVRATL